MDCVRFGSLTFRVENNGNCLTQIDSLVPSVPSYILPAVPYLICLFITLQIAEYAVFVAVGIFST